MAYFMYTCEQLGQMLQKFISVIDMYVLFITERCMEIKYIQIR